MKLYAVEYNPEENEGVYALSVVKNPAMQSQWITLNESKGIKLATVDKERRILMGVALIPNKPIYRNENGFEYNVIFSSKVIEKAAHDFVKKGNVNNSTLEHEIDLGSDAVSVVESWIVEDDVNDKTRKYGFKEPVGSWAVMMKVHDDKTWEKAKKGEILGFSIDGLFNLREISKQVNMSEKKKSLSLKERLLKFLNEDSEPAPAEETDVKLMSVMTADGVEIMYEGETLEQGTPVFIENEGERVPLPVGEYALEDGGVLVVVEEGIFDSMKEAEEEIPLSDAEKKAIEEIIDAMGLKEVNQKLESLETKLSEVVKENESLKVQLSEIGKQPAVQKVQAKKEVQLTAPKNSRERILATIQKHKN